ncbi:hypothetical protein [Pseudarthrobacter niigatensis]|uniref:Ribosomally synthesized peptide with SipW-like signal peptide n=1 Tax=Pseudarthrobacter niigatensis TaxID=369935 RepID=A0AAJ1WFJ9_9MICC|nr:hypothetical protein [Pseudarthrobacter niigatensis]MDQ0145945.1 hypothetical protein [Pseudarthrobacter niigatensis]MDQ0266327.1 hypothetical protein [Pseudarthrobacter niigatensis]
MTPTRSRGLKAAALAGLLVTAGAGTAYAFWSGTGAGSGSAAAGTMQVVTVDALVASDNPKAALYPGGSADVVLRLTNPNPYSVQVYSVTGNGPVTADSAHPRCTTTGVTFTGTAAPLAPATYVAANSSALITLPGAATMDTTSLAACQGATFSVPVTAEVRK